MVKTLAQGQSTIQVHPSNLHGRSVVDRAQLGKDQLVILEALRIGKVHRVGGTTRCTQTCSTAGNGCPIMAVPGQRTVRTQQDKARWIGRRLVIGTGEVDAIDHFRGIQAGQQTTAHLGRVDVLGVRVHIQSSGAATAQWHRARGCPVGQSCDQRQLGQLHRRAHGHVAAERVAQTHLTDLHAKS